MMTPEEIEFSTFCIGSVSETLKMPQADVYLKLRDSGILRDYIVKCYDVLHTFGRRYLVDDIVSLMREKNVL